MEPPHGLVDVMEKVGAGRDQAIDQSVFDEIHDQPAHPRGYHRPGHPHHDHDPVAEHVVPDLIGGGEIPSLERNTLHFLEQGSHILPAVD